MSGLDEILARHFVHRAQDRGIADPAPAQRQQKFHAADIAVAEIGIAIRIASPPLLSSAAFRLAALS